MLNLSRNDREHLTDRTLLTSLTVLNTNGQTVMILSAPYPAALVIITLLILGRGHRKSKSSRITKYSATKLCSCDQLVSVGTMSFAVQGLCFKFGQKDIIYDFEPRDMLLTFRSCLKIALWCVRLQSSYWLKTRLLDTPPPPGRPPLTDTPG